MKIFLVTFDVDRYRSLLAKDDSVHDQRLMALDGSSKATQWPRPLEAEVDNTALPAPDIYSCDAGNMLLTGRSLEILEPELKTIAELLPVSFGRQTGYVVNIIGFSNCLDSKNTRWCIDPKSKKKLFIEKYAFIKDNVPRTPLFKIAEDRFSLFCADHEDGTEALPALVRRNRLKGVKFENVWTI